MTITSASLLERLKSPAGLADDWQKLHDIYVPLIRDWLNRLGVNTDEVDDLSQEVWIVVHRKLATFARQRDGSFRTWLRQLAVNQVRNWRRKEQGRPADHVADDLFSQLEAPDSQLTRQWEHEHDRHVFEKLLEVVRPDFAPATWEVFCRFALEGVPVAVVANEFATTEAAVLQAKSRILKRLRQEAEGLID